MIPVIINKINRAEFRKYYEQRRVKDHQGVAEDLLSPPIMMLSLHGTCKQRPKEGCPGGPAAQKTISSMPWRPGTRTPRRKIKQAIAFQVQPERGRWPGQLEIRSGGQARG